MGEHALLNILCAFFLLFRWCFMSLYKRKALVIFNVGRCGMRTENSLLYPMLYVTMWCFCTNTGDMMLAIPFGLYQTWFEYPGRSPILLVHVTPAFKCKRRYCLPGTSLIFDRYLTLMKLLQVNWLLSRHKISSIPDYAPSSRMVSPTHIMLELRLLCENYFWDSSVLAYICNNVCDEVWYNMRPEGGRSSHSLVGMSIMRLHDASSTFTNVLSPTPS